MGLQRNTSPIVSDVTEQSMLNLVPFAGAWRVMTDLNRHAGLVRKSLQFQFPKSIAMAVASPAVCSDQ